jgi:uncharacterized OB-fold protein
MPEAKPLHEGLFTWPASTPSLIGSRCTDCGEHAFPSQGACRACSGQNMASADLGSEGTLWTWTVQSFMPKTPYHTDETPETFRPYGVGYVELACGLKVESRLKENTPDELKIGMPMKLEIITVRKDDEGSDLLTFQFCAAEEQN